MNKQNSARLSSRDNQNKALLALLFGAIGISLSPIFVRLSEVEPTVSAFYRTGLAVPMLLLWPFLLPARKQSVTLGPHGRQLGYLFVLAGLFFAFDLIFWHRSIALTSVANATLFPNFAPVIVTIVAWFLFGEKITRGFVLGLSIAVIGAIIIVGDSFGRGGSNFRGDMMGLATAFFYAGYLIVVSRLRRAASVQQIMLWSSVISALILLAFALFSGDNLAPASLYSWLVLLALAGVSQVGGQGMIAYALAHLPVSFSSVGLLIQPALAALFGYLILSEPIGAWQGAGVMIILVGIYLARRGSDH